MSGWNGVTVTFGDGCDADTLNTMFGPMVQRGYVVRLNDQDILLRAIETLEDGTCALVGKPFREDDTYDDVADERIPFDDIATIHIY